MYKRKYSMAFALLVGILLLSCQKNSGQKTAAENAVTEETDSPVIVYSPQGEEDVDYILTAAEKNLDFEVQILRIDGGALADRLLAEKINPQADVVLGITQLSMAQLKQEGVLAPYKPSWAAQLSSAFQDPEHYFTSFWQTPIVIAYNSDFMSAEQAPKSWLDLVKPEYKGKFTIGSTGWQTTRAYLVGMLWRFYDSDINDVSSKGWDFMRQLYANATPFPGGEEVGNLLKNGEMPIRLHWYGGTVKEATNLDINLQYVNTEGGTPMVAEAIALIQGRNNKNAKAFIDWFGNAEFQVQVANDLGKAPALSAAMAKAPQETRDNISFFSPQDIDWGKAVEHLDDWLSKIELEIIP